MSILTTVILVVCALVVLVPLVLAYRDDADAEPDAHPLHHG